MQNEQMRNKMWKKMWDFIDRHEKLVDNIKIFLWLLWVAIAFTAMLLTSEYPANYE